MDSLTSCVTLARERVWRRCRLDYCQKTVGVGRLLKE